MITKNYNNQPMTGITEVDYETLVGHLHEQVVACMGRDAYPEGEAEKRAADMLNNTWSDQITVRQWLARVGEALEVDTSQCVGA